MDDFFSSFFSTLLGVPLNWLNNRINNRSLTGKEREQNAFNAGEAQKQRDYAAEQTEKAMSFNASEAQKLRDFNAQQDNTLYQRRVSDMAAAGVNPALAVSGVGSALGSSGPASVSPASGSSASGSASLLPQSMSDLMQLSLLRKQANLIDSQVSNNDAKTVKELSESGLVKEQTFAQRLQNKWFEPMKKVELDNLLSDLKSKSVERDLKRSNISVNDAERALILTQDIIAKADAATRDDLNRASLRRLIAEASLDERRLDSIDAEIKEIYSRVLLNGLQGNLYDAETKESFKRAGLIEAQTRSEGFSGDIKEQEKIINEPRVNNRKLDYWLGLGGRTIESVGRAASPVVIGRGLSRAGSRALDRADRKLFNGMRGSGGR